MSFKGQKFVPPPSSGWSWYNQSSSTATTVNNGAINLYMPKHGSAGSTNVTGYTRTAPSTPYTIIANVTYNSVDINNATGVFLTPGLGFTDGTAHYWINPRIYDTGYGLCVLYGINSTTGSSNDYNNQPATATAYPWPVTCWYMIRNNGTNIYWYISNDTQDNGRSWVQVYSAASGAHSKTWSSAGVFWDAEGRVDMNVTINSWRELAV